jgi:hypothetical protein
MLWKVVFGWLIVVLKDGNRMFRARPRPPYEQSFNCIIQQKHAASCLTPA